jgi:hypothetical protein
MLTLLGSLVGFFGSMLPDILKMFRDKSDKKHELAVLKLQMEREEKGFIAKQEAITAEAFSNRVIAETKRDERASPWIIDLNASVRPVISYAMFFLYAGVKVAIIYGGYSGEIWGEEDSATFAGIMSFYFGQRSMSKLNGSR